MTVEAKLEPSMKSVSSVINVIEEAEGVLSVTNKKHNQRVGNLIATVIATSYDRTFRNLTLKRSIALKELSRLGIKADDLTRFVAKVYWSPDSNYTPFVESLLTKESIRDFQEPRILIR